MVKSVSIEESFRDRCTRAVCFTYGLIVGGTLKDEECLFLPIEAPSRSNDGNQVTSIMEIDEKWVWKHCRNMRRMIPGGVRLSGLFVTASNEDVIKNESHMIKILGSVCAADKCALTGLISDDHSEKIVLFCDPNSKKISCKSIDLDDSRDSLRSVDIRVKAVLNRWQALKTSITLSVEATLPSDRRKEKILKRLELAVEPYLRALVTNTNMMVCGDVRSDEELLFNTSATSGAGGSQKQPQMRLKNALIEAANSSDATASYDYWSSLEFTFFGPQYPIWLRGNSGGSSSESGASSDTGFVGSNISLSQRSASLASSPIEISEGEESAAAAAAAEEEDEGQQRLSVNGIIPGIAFLPVQNTTLGQVKKAFREDLVRSTLSRLELLTDELHITSGEFEVPRMYMPQRVLVRLPACRQLPLSDYKFTSETPDDVVARLIYFCLPLASSADSSSSESATVTHQLSPICTRRLNTPSSLPDDANTRTTASAAAAVGEEAASVTAPVDPDSGHDSFCDDQEIAIDTSCLDVQLEYAPNSPEEKELADINHNIDQVVRLQKSRAGQLLLLCSVAVLIICVGLSYFFIHL